MKMPSSISLNVAPNCWYQHITHARGDMKKVSVSNIKKYQLTKNVLK